MSDKIDWPEYYDPATGNPRSPGHERPEWSRTDCKLAGQRLAARFAADPAFGQQYLNVVQLWNANRGGDYTDRYRRVIVQEYHEKDGLPFNEHDFANVHRATWLWLLEGFARLVNHNPHQHGNVGDWGDPDPGNISRGDDINVRGVGAAANLFIFHNVPNGSGAFGMSTADIQPPLVTN
jgi:hypothetical protein